MLCESVLIREKKNLSVYNSSFKDVGLKDYNTFSGAFVVAGKQPYLLLPKKALKWTGRIFLVDQYQYD